VTLAVAGPIPAARVWGRAERLRAEIGVAQDPPQRARYQRYVDAARVALRDEAAFECAWNDGRALTLDEVLRYAMDE